MVQSSDNPALQLFQQEQQELLEQVGQALTALTESPSLTEFQRLRRSVRLIHQGAVQMEVGAIAERTTQFLRLLQPHISPPGERLSNSQLDRLTHLFHELQHIDISLRHATPILDPPSPFQGEPAAEPPCDSTPDFSESPIDEPETSSGLHVAQDIRQILLQNDIAEAIAQLEQSLCEQSNQAIIAASIVQIDALLGWGEVLDWPELVTFVETLSQSLQAHPEAVTALVRMGVLGLQAIHDRAIMQSSLSFHDELEEEELTPASSPDLTPTTYLFQTAKKFIWQSQHMIFVVDSGAIAETVMPKPTDIQTYDNQPVLKWNQQYLAIVNLNEVLAKSTSEILQTPTSPSAALGPILVLKTSETTTALQIDLEQFVRQPELRITPIPDKPAFYLGTTSIQNQVNLVLIDVVGLLSHHLPAAPAPVPLSHQAASSSPPSQIVPPAMDIPAEPAGPPHILVVDDSRTIRYLLQHMFEQAGYQVSLAHDGLDAIQQLEDHPSIDLMVSDVEMPKLTGFELLSRCRRQKQWQQLPIIILSQCQTDQHDQLSEQFGADAYLPKPFDHSTMLDLVSALLTAAPN